ncbi:hypothetical protein LY76DRAFT_343287 [Colletotrichum caudatum]|nr:hypothetical protein LY76DRAFT_343287 [Colletotrichum caudatum]
MEWTPGVEKKTCDAPSLRSRMRRLDSAGLIGRRQRPGDGDTGGLGCLGYSGRGSVAELNEMEVRAGAGCPFCLWRKKQKLRLLVGTDGYVHGYSRHRTLPPPRRKTHFWMMRIHCRLAVSCLGIMPTYTIYAY